MHEFSIPELTNPPMKFLGGILSLSRPGDFTSLQLDYTHHASKLREVDYQKSMDVNELLPPRLHQAFRSNLGIASYLVHYGFPAAAFEISLLASAAN